MKISNIEKEFQFSLSEIDDQIKWLDYLWGADFDEDVDEYFSRPSISLASFLVNHSKMLVVYAASVFEALMGDVTKLIILNSVDSIKSSEKKLSYKEIFTFHSQETLLEELISRRINEIKYMSIGKQIEELDSKYGFNLDLVPTDLTGIIELFECRNIILHNKGIINSVYLEKTGKPNHLKGSKYPFSEDYLEDCHVKLYKVGTRILEKAKEKYKYSGIS